MLCSPYLQEHGQEYGCALLAFPRNTARSMAVLCSPYLQEHGQEYGCAMLAFPRNTARSKPVAVLCSPYLQEHPVRVPLRRGLP